MLKFFASVSNMYYMIRRATWKCNKFESPFVKDNLKDLVCKPSSPLSRVNASSFAIFKKQRQQIIIYNFLDSLQRAGPAVATFLLTTRAVTAQMSCFVSFSTSASNITLLPGTRTRACNSTSPRGSNDKGTSTTIFKSQYSAQEKYSQVLQEPPLPGTEAPSPQARSCQWAGRQSALMCGKGGGKEDGKQCTPAREAKKQRVGDIFRFNIWGGEVYCKPI